MAAWKQAHADLLDDIQAHRDAESAAHAFAATAEAARGAIDAALAEAGAPPLPGGCAIADAIARAEEWLEAQRAAREARDQTARQLEKLEGDTIPEAEDARNRAEERLADWRAEWGALAEALGLSATASPGEVLAVVDAINGLLGKAEKAHEYRERMARIRRDGAAFEEDVRNLLAAAAPDRTGGDAVASVQALYAALKQARAARQARDGLKKQRETEAGRMREAEVTLAQVNAEREALCAEAGVTDPEDLPAPERPRRPGPARVRIAGDRGARLLAPLRGRRPGGAPRHGRRRGCRRHWREACPNWPIPSPIWTASALHCRKASASARRFSARWTGATPPPPWRKRRSPLSPGWKRTLRPYARLKLARTCCGPRSNKYRAANEEPMLARAGGSFKPSPSAPSPELAPM